MQILNISIDFLSLLHIHSFFSFLFLKIIHLAASALSCIVAGLPLQPSGFLLVARGLRCPLECGVLVPWPGIKPVFPVLQGRFVTTGSPRKSQFILSLLE